MTPLRQRMIEEMHLRNYSKHSIAAYVSAVYRLANHYGRRPDRLSREEIRNFLVDLVEVKQVSWPYYKQVLAALRFFYRHVVRRGEVVDDIRGPRPAKTLPVVLSPAEVARFFRAIPSLKQRTILMLAYGAGLRVGEVVELRLSDIDRERRVIRVRQAKNKKDRYTMLSPALVEMLDRYLWAAAARGSAVHYAAAGSADHAAAPYSDSARQRGKRPGSKSGSRPTRYVTVSPPIYWRRGLT